MIRAVTEGGRGKVFSSGGFWFSHEAGSRRLTPPVLPLIFTSPDVESLESPAFLGYVTTNVYAGRRVLFLVCLSQKTCGHRQGHVDTNMSAKTHKGGELIWSGSDH